MALKGAVSQSGSPTSQEVYLVGEDTMRCEFSCFSAATAQSNMRVLSGYPIASQEISRFAPQESRWVIYSLRTDESRREAMLATLKRLRTLKAELRRKYGEFNIEEDLREMRNERLGDLS